MAHAPRAAASLAALLLLLGSGALRPAAAAPGGAHPYFDDRGTLEWYRSSDEARAAARAKGKLIFIEFGRRECHNCRLLVQTILPADGLRERMADLCVGLAAECDEPEPKVDALFARGLPGANTLPFVGFVTPDLEWVTGWAGSVGADVFGRHLRLAEGRRPACPARIARTPPRAAPVPEDAVVATRAPATPVPPPTARPPTPASRPELPAVAPATPRAADGPARLPLAPSAPAPCAGTIAAVDLLPRARAASAAGRHGEALRLWAAARGRPEAGSADAWAPVVARADVWAEDLLCAGVLAARERRWSDASDRLATVRREAPDRPAARDARIGERALARLREGGAPATGYGPLDASAVSEFRGTRWARLFAP